MGVGWVGVHIVYPSVARTHDIFSQRAEAICACLAMDSGCELSVSGTNVWQTFQ